ncbi:uncharacterized protein LOC144100037 [Amblyomma americanum]
MASIRYPEIQDSNVLAQIAAARQANGVHVYIDEPGNEIYKTYEFILRNLNATGTAKVRYTVLLRATADSPTFALGVTNDYGRGRTTTTIETGIYGRNRIPHGLREALGSWHGKKGPNPLVIKTGEYLVCTAELQHQAGKKLEYEFNGKLLAGKSDFSGIDLAHLYRKAFYHERTYENINALEWHYEYTGITEGLEPSANDKDISLKKYNHCHMSAGSTATIRGKYKQMNTSYQGMAIGIQKVRRGNPDVHDFRNHKDPGKAVTFRLAVGDAVTIVYSPTEAVRLENAPAGDEAVCLTFQNIAIENLEIHTGRLKRGT